jgi:hypothetical protein
LYVFTDCMEIVLGLSPSDTYRVALLLMTLILIYRTIVPGLARNQAKGTSV